MEPECAEQDTNAKGVGVSTSVPNCPRGRLMYYLDCVNSLLDLSDQTDISKLRNYEMSHLLTEADTDNLIRLCFLYSPDKLDKHIIFHDDELCGDSLNKFYNLIALKFKYRVSETMQLGGCSRKVFKVMTYKRKWLLRNWINPMHFYSDRLETIASCRNKEQSQDLGYQSASATYRKDSENTRLLKLNAKRNICCCCTIL